LAFSTHKFLLLFVITFVAFLAGSRAFGQEVTIHGTVYNMYRTKPLDGVSVICTSGRGTATDSNGNYALVADLKDSISFSYLGKATMKYPIKDINYYSGFDISLHVDPVELKEIRVMPHNYRDDSSQNRKDYEKIFDYKKPGFKITDGSGGLGAGVDLNSLIEMFERNKINRTKAFQRRLVDEEQDKYVDHRFARSVVLKITHLQGDELDSFIIKYRPSYTFCKKATDYDLYDYIKLAFSEYQKDRKDRP
jgi:hypothetical protein